MERIKGTFSSVLVLWNSCIVSTRDFIADMDPVIMICIGFSLFLISGGSMVIGFVYFLYRANDPERIYKKKKEQMYFPTEQ